MALCLVTGAAGALGAAVARTLAARGDDVALVDRPQARARLDALAAELAPRATAHVSIEDGAYEYAALIAGGWAGGAPMHEAKDESALDAMLDSNVRTVHAALRSLLPGMVARKRGAIVVIGSRNVERPWTGANAAAYTASKSAAVALAQASAAEVLEHGVRINSILPSTMDTPANRASMPKADFSRWVTTSSAAAVVAFLLSDGARDVSGAVVPVYGRA
ncbi:MAG TPA: SDR family NAD(P)-dependent oxidoreductase [Polyangiaceae bacterium]|jgi:NAD(P)-dependent dehydrogenase (short-subunit alcohol dehydrogenase family)